MAPKQVPLRVDLAGGWFDVPRLARPGAYIVNLAITPMVSLDHWPYQQGSGLGGSAAHAILQGRDAFASEDALGVGWQDPAVILETGLCVWRSGPSPVLELKRNPDFLAGLMGLLWTGCSHHTPSNAGRPRDYSLIDRAGETAWKAVRWGSYPRMREAIVLSYEAQLKEGMDRLPGVENCVAGKYCGGGWGGYALYCFATREHRDDSGLIPIEPYLQDPGTQL